MRGTSHERTLRGRGETLLAVACVAAMLSVAAAGNVTSLHNVSDTLTGVDAARAIVTWPLKADDAPMGIVMAGGTLGNNAVMSRATGDDGSLDQWKGKVKDAAEAAMDEVIEEVMEDDPDDVSSLGKDSSTYKELQNVAAKARKLTVKVAKIGDGGAASANANSKAAAQAEAAAIMAASQAAVTEAYDMPPPPEAAEDAPFARKKTHVGVLKSQKRVVSRHGSKIAVIASPRVRTPVVKVLATTRKVKGPMHHGLTQKRDVQSGRGGVVGALKRVLSSPLTLLMSLDEEDEEDADAPTDEEAAREDAGDAALEEDKPPCAVGTFGPDGGPCVLCPNDTYKDVEGPDECTVCPEGTRTAHEGTSALKDCWDGPMDLESPMGMVMAGPKLSDPEILNKSITSGTIDVWKGKVKDAAKNAVREVEEEMMDDDLLGVQGQNGQTAKELNAVVEKARSMTKTMGKVELGGEWAWSAKKKAEAQADAVAFMAAHEAAVADSYVDDPDNDLPLNRKEEVMYPTGQHNMHKERGEYIGYPRGNRPYYARKGEEEHVGEFLDSSVGGGSKAYYDAARRAAGAMMRQARMKVSTPARLQSLDALWEGIPPDSDGSSQVDQNVWIGAVAGESPQKEQMMEHNLQHSFLAGNGPVSLGAVATGSSAGSAGAGFTGVSGSVWHPSWIASSDSSIAAPSPTIADLKATGSTTKYSKATKAGDRIAQQEAAALTPPGSGMRGPPTQASAASSSTSGCTSDQITLCHAGCDSKLNLEMQSADSQNKWKTNCMSKCLGPCAKELGFAAQKAAQKIEAAMTDEENLINKLTKEFDGKSASSSTASVASDAIKNLEKRARIHSGSSSSGSGGSGTDVWHQTPGVLSSPTGSAARVFPEQPQKEGQQTGVYDCSGQAITVGAVVGRMIPGRACEDQYLVVTAGMWKVTDYKVPGAAEVVEMRHGVSTSGRVAVVLHGISPNVNKGTRVELVPFVGSFTHWKLVRGHTKDMFLPANVAAISSKGHHNQAGVLDSSGFTQAFHKRPSAIVDKTGKKNSESVLSAQMQRDNDWGQTSITERQDANLAMCPGPSCPTDGPSKSHRIIHLGNPFWKYIIVALVIGTVLAYQYLKRINDGLVPAGVLQDQYVQLPSFIGGGGGGTGGSGKDGFELKNKGGSKPCPGMKGSDRIVMVENASDRIIMVDVGGGGGSSARPSRGKHGSGDTASQDVGYQ